MGSLQTSQWQKLLPHSLQGAACECSERGLPCWLWWCWGLSQSCLDQWSWWSGRVSQLVKGQEICSLRSQLYVPVCEFLMPLLSFSSFSLDCFRIVMTFSGIGLWEETSWQDFHVTNWVFWHVPCDFITLLTPINNACFSFQWQKCEAIDWLMNKVVSWKWKQTGLLNTWLLFNIFMTTKICITVPNGF